jgi:hypothetical protein
MGQEEIRGSGRKLDSCDAVLLLLPFITGFSCDRTETEFQGFDNRLLILVLTSINIFFLFL